MPKRINQSVAIANLNQYLEWHNLPVRMDRTGICKGLACVYAKYVLEDREEQFYTILEKIATMTSAPELEDEINHFVVEVLLSHMPQIVDNEKGQSDSIEFLMINGHPLKSSFHFGLITNVDNWSTIFNDINLRENEVMLVDLANHSVSVRKIKGKYRIYDSNNPSGFREFASENELAEELHRISRYVGIDGSLGMTIEVIRHPDDKNASRKFPERHELYTKYFDPNLTVSIKRTQTSSLAFAINSSNDPDLCEFLAKNVEDKNPIRSAMYAIDPFNPKILAYLLTKIPAADEDKLFLLFDTALLHGKNEAFDALLKNERCKTFFDNDISTHAKSMIHHAATGSNLELLQQLIDYYKNTGKPQPVSEQSIAEKIMGSYADEGDAIRAAIIGLKLFPSEPRCVQLLFDQLKKADYTLTEEQYKYYLLIAISTNQPRMVDLIVNIIKNDLSEISKNNLFKSIKMSVADAKYLDLSILKILKKEQVRFSNAAQGIIDQKENRPIGLLTSMGISLVEFTYFIKFLCSVSFNAMKDCMKEIKPERSQPKNSEPNQGPS